MCNMCGVPSNTPTPTFRDYLSTHHWKCESTALLPLFTSVLSHHLLWPLTDMTVHAKQSFSFIALSCILQAAKDILYSKGNASSLQPISIRYYGPFAITICMILLCWWQPDVIKSSFFPPKWENSPITQIYPVALLLLVILWSLHCLLWRNGHNLTLTSEPQIWFANTSYPLSWILFSLSRSGVCVFLKIRLIVLN